MSLHRGVRVILAVLLIALCAAVSYYLLIGLGRRPTFPNVLWITMDSMRADHLGCTGHGTARTPTIDALAREGALFTQNISQSTYTRISVPSMITGKYPYFVGIRMMVPDLDSSQVTLAEALRAKGYFTYAIAEPWRPGFFQGLERLDKNDTSTIQKTQWCLEALDQLDDRPFFIWLYYWDPHAPYAPPVEFMRAYHPGYTWEDDKSYSKARVDAADEDLRDPTGHYAGTTVLLLRLNQDQITLTQAERNHLTNLYDAEIALVDSKIKEVLDRLKELDLWDNTMVVLNADHGEAFGEHGRYYHGYTIYEEEVRVPLIVKAPQPMAEGKVIGGPVRNLDIMPTILDYCGIPAPADIQGQSLRPFMETDLFPNLPACIETHRIQTQNHLMGYRDGRYKLIYNLSHGGAELYDLEADPGERNNLLAGAATAEEHRGPATQLEAQLREKLLKTLEVKALAVLKLGETPRLIDPETKEQLKALGYIY
jgi:arylsulfatase